ncbi:response regulator [Phenylobacterium sp.]|uniref:response regulator transcription factor n=1 Tax=Phenylobacterium sp. TaxID=1871053 RepID=UPI001225F5FE|nr:response regulator [Phenylobacterium sp.]THD56545.1 MAG: response regulator transcription factor [Phenylobacterium sp.]
MPSRRTMHIVDDDDDVRESAALLLEASGYAVTTYASGVEFLAKVDPTIPACVLLDIHMPQMDGLEVQRRMVERGIGFPVIVLTGQGDISIAVQAMKYGAFEFLEKPYLNDVLLEAARDAFVKLETVSEDRAMTAQAKAGVAKLTPRETEVLSALLAGLPNKLIAFELEISVRTVEIYRANVMDKLDARSLSTAVRIALAAGVEPLIAGRGR